MTSKPIKIVDVSTLVPGPFATYLLEKHLGARVVKIEDSNLPDQLAYMRPTKDGVGLGYLGINQGKSVAKVDMRQDGADKIKKEIRDADVLVENFKTGKAFKLGLAYEDAVKINPKLIYCSITGYPAKHPLAGKSAHDVNILAVTGYLDQRSRLEKTLALPPILLADMFTAYHLAIKILAALAKSAGGQHIQVAMLEAMLEAMTLNNYPLLQTGKDWAARDFVMSGEYPCYRLYEAKDGGRVAVAALEKPLWVDFCQHLGQETWVDRQFDPTLGEEVSTEMKKRDRFYWLKVGTDFCVTPVMTVNEAVNKKYV